MAVSLSLVLHGMKCRNGGEKRRKGNCFVLAVAFTQLESGTALLQLLKSLRRDPSGFDAEHTTTVLYDSFLELLAVSDTQEMETMAVKTILNE